jgi:hypothetical protein
MLVAVPECVGGFPSVTRKPRAVFIKADPGGLSDEDRRKLMELKDMRPLRVCVCVCLFARART